MECDIFDYGYDGEGVGKIDDKICFVPFSLKGEKVEVAKIKETSSFVKAKIQKVITKSDLRDVPPCPYFEKCGGCAYQHTSYQNELEIKKELLSRQLKKIGYNGVIEVISGEEYGYRNKVKLFCQSGKIGFKERQTNSVCDIEKCLLAKNEIMATGTYINI